MAETSLDRECGSWKVPEHDVEIEYALDVLAEIDRTVIDGFNRLRRGGVEVGGVLFGVRHERMITILAFRPLSCEHALGPNFILSNNDEIALATLLESSRTDPLLAGLIPVGWYHSHTRSHIHLSSQDLDLFNRYFAELWQIALVLRPVHSEATRCGFFFREEDGSVHAERSYREFSLSPASFDAPARKTEREMLLERAANKTSLPVYRAPVAPNYPPGSRPAVSNGFRRKAVMTAILTTAAVAFIWGWTAIPRAEPPRRDSLGLTFEDHDGQLRIAWNRAAAPIRESRNALLRITEGDHTAEVELDAGQLRGGTVLYKRESENVGVAMKIAGIEESAVFVGAAPYPAAAQKELPNRRERMREAADAAPKPEEKLVPVSERKETVDELSADKPATAKKAPPRIFSMAALPRRPEPAPIDLLPPPVVGIASQPMPVIGSFPVIPPPPKRTAPPAPVPHAAPSPGKGTLIWTGLLPKNSILSIDGNRPSIGTLSGTIPPGRPFVIRVYPAELTNAGLTVYSSKYAAGHAEPPGPDNGWNKAIYVRDPKRAGAVSVLEFPNSKNGWTRFVLRGEVSKLSVILIEWNTQ